MPNIIENFIDKFFQKAKVIPELLVLFSFLFLISPTSIRNFIHFLSRTLSKLFPDIWNSIFGQSWFTYHEFFNAWFVLLIIFFISSIWELITDLSIIIIEERFRIGSFFFYINSFIFSAVLVYSKLNPDTDYSASSLICSFDLLSDNNTQFILQCILFVSAKIWFFFLFSVTYLTPIWEIGFFIICQEYRGKYPLLKTGFFLVLYASVVFKIISRVLN